MNNQLQTILPSTPLIEVKESNEYLTCRREKSKQIMCEKRAMESDGQQNKRNSQNALNMRKKRALEITDKNLNRCQNESAQKRQRRLKQCANSKYMMTEQLSTSNRKLLRNF
ncbi:4247_t:CDS:1, partial [Cetraspora pellucida]